MVIPGALIAEIGSKAENERHFVISVGAEKCYARLDVRNIGWFQTVK